MPKKKVSFKELLGLEGRISNIEDLHPPMAPPLVSHTEEETKDWLKGTEKIQMTSEKLSIDFMDIAESSDFQRFIIYLAKKITPGLFKGVSTRVSNKKMVEQFNSKREEYKLVMKELKEVLEHRKTKENSK